MLAPLAAWIAIRGQLDAVPIWLAAVIFFWVGGFDIIYACQDAEFDRQSSLFSVPARWGVPIALRIAAVSHVCAAACLFGLWYSAGLGHVFLIGILVVSLLLAYEHWIVGPDDLTRVNIAFFQVNAVISLGLFFVGVADLWLG